MERNTALECIITPLNKKRRPWLVSKSKKEIIVDLLLQSAKKLCLSGQLKNTINNIWKKEVALDLPRMLPKDALILFVAMVKLDFWMPFVKD